MVTVKIKFVIVVISPSAAKSIKSEAALPREEQFSPQNYFH
jgi:hypothetical protein